MDMINSITLEKYKSFKNKTTVDLKPLTILCGVNSSGKSSVLKSLLMMKQTVEKESPYNKLAFMGNYVDNGYFEDIMNHDCADDKSFVLQNDFILTRRPVKHRKSQDLQAFKDLQKLYYQIPDSHKIDKFKISHYVVVEKSSKSGLLAYIDNNNVLTTKIMVSAFDSDNNELPQFNGYLELTKSGEDDAQDRSYSLNYVNLPFNDTLYTFPSEYGKQFICYFSNIKLVNFYRKSGILPEMLNLKSTLLTLFDIVSGLYAGIRFIAPLRYSPSRFYTVSGDVNSVGINGENAPVLLAKLKDRPAYTEIAVPYTDNTGNVLFDFEHEEPSLNFGNQVQRWFDYLDLGKIGINGKGQFSVSLSGHNIADVGFGVSQAMPIVVQGLSLRKDETLLLEQPEIHLHPKMQMKMADFLFALAKSERNVIVETHSDHLVNRIIRRCLENSELRDMVTILFFSKDETGATKIEEIKVDTHLGIESAPVDFFDQYTSETDMIIQRGYQNMLEDSQKNAQSA